MSADKGKRTLSKEEIRAYLDGQMKGKAAHDLERHLLNDPFDQEAMEGFEHISLEETDHDLEVLSQRLRHVERKPNYLLRLVATVSILLVSGWAVWYVLDQYSRQPAELSMKTEKPAADSVEYSRREAGAPEIRKVPEKPASEKQPEPPQKKAAEPAESLQPEPLIADAFTSEPKSAEEEVFDLEVPLPAEREVMATEPTEDTLSGMSFHSDDVKSKKLQIRGGSALRSSAHSGLFISGVVTDEDGNPLPGVSVIEQGAGNATLSDIDGAYRLQVSQAQPILLFAHVGMKAEQLRADTSGVMNMEMEADVMALSEVVVSRNTEAVEEEAGFESATPMGGFPAFRKYLEENLVYPKAAREKSIEGKVILNVQILPGGSVGAIEVRRSIGYGCDQEAIRLVEDGPAWIPARRNGQQVASEIRVKVVFELP